MKAKGGSNEPGKKSDAKSDTNQNLKKAKPMVAGGRVPAGRRKSQPRIRHLRHRLPS
jgi:hypothetical protein